MKCVQHRGRPGRAPKDCDDCKRIRDGEVADGEAIPVDAKGETVNTEVVSVEIQTANRRARGKKDDFGDKVKTHQRYYIVEPDGKRVMVPGATTVLQQVPKPYLVNWANRLGLEGVDVNKYKDEAADTGSCLHHLVESYLANTEPKLDDFTPAQLERAKLGLEAFKAWREAEAPDLKVIGTELRLVSHKHRFGGTIDLYCQIGGRYTLIDYKTAANVYLEHKAQLTAYVRMAQENDLRVQDAIVIQLPRTEGGTYAPHKLVPQHMSLYWRLFEWAMAGRELQAEIRAVGA